MCIGLSWNLQAFNSREKTSNMGSKLNKTIMHVRATKHFQYGLLDPQKKEKKIKLFTRESSQQVKEEREIFLGFHFNFYYKQGN